MEDSLRDDCMERAVAKAAQAISQSYAEYCTTGIINPVNKDSYLQNSEPRLRSFLQKVLSCAWESLNREPVCSTTSIFAHVSPQQFPDTIEPFLLNFSIGETLTLDLENNSHTSTSLEGCCAAVATGIGNEWQITERHDQETLSGQDIAPPALDIGLYTTPYLDTTLSEEATNLLNSYQQSDHATLCATPASEPDLSTDFESLQSMNTDMFQGRLSFSTSRNTTETPCPQNSGRLSPGQTHTLQATTEQETQLERDATEPIPRKRRKKNRNTSLTEDQPDHRDLCGDRSDADVPRCAPNALDYSDQLWSLENSSIQIHSTDLSEENMVRVKDLVQNIGDGECLAALFSLMVEEGSGRLLNRDEFEKASIAQIYNRIMQREDTIKKHGLRQWHDLTRLFEIAREAVRPQASQTFRFTNGRVRESRGQRGNPENAFLSEVTDRMIEIVTSETTTAEQSRDMRNTMTKFRRWGSRLSSIAERFGRACVGIAYVSSRGEREGKGWKDHM